MIEYRCVSTTNQFTSDDLNFFGKDGWDNYSILHFQDKFYYYFKRIS